MRSYFIIFLLLFSSFALVYEPKPASAWGFSVHSEISNQAIDLLPEPWNSYFKEYADELANASIAPDLRKSEDPAESGRHYDDQDEPHWDRNVPFPSKNWSLGVVSWAVENSTRDLIKALQNDDHDAIIRYMGDIAHYVSDAAQPFHATKNYDGQYTGNRGIHSRFETEVVSIYSNSLFNLTDFTELTIIPNTYNMTEEQISSGLALVPNILEADDLALQESGSYNDKYYEILYNETKTIIKDRLQLAIQNVANTWYTAFMQADWYADGELQSSSSQFTSTQQSSSHVSSQTVNILLPTHLMLAFITFTIIIRYYREQD